MTLSTRNILNKSSLLDRVTTYQIFKAYCKNFVNIGKAFKSEFREDPHPSCMIEYIGGDLLYTDFGEGSYRAIEFVMRKYSLQFYDALSKINNDFGLNLVDHNENTTYIPKQTIKITDKHPAIRERSRTQIKVRYSPYTADDLQYWNQYGWTEEMLKMASIRPIDYYWLTIEHKNMIDVPFAVTNELAYTYDYYRHNGIYRRKLYFPTRKGPGKWISNVDDTIIQNWDLIPKSGGDTLFITSSKKDCGGYYRLYNTWNAIAPNNEQAFLPEKIFFTKIKPRWRRVVIWLDNDDTGIKNALKWSQKYQLEAVWNPLRCPHKDQSDLIAADGLREFNYQLQKLIYKL